VRREAGDGFVSEIDEAEKFMGALAPALTMMGYADPEVIKGPDMIRYQWKIGERAGERIILTMVISLENS